MLIIWIIANFDQWGSGGTGIEILNSGYLLKICTGTKKHLGLNECTRPVVWFERRPVVLVAERRQDGRCGEPARRCPSPGQAASDGSGPGVHETALAVDPRQKIPVPTKHIDMSLQCTSILRVLKICRLLP
jgi:hypothetical protein